MTRKRLQQMLLDHGPAVLLQLQSSDQASTAQRMAAQFD